jgi:hypothetical protein
VTDDLTQTPNPDTDAAYQRADQPDSVGMRALAGLFLLEHEFRRVPGAPDLARLVVNRLNRFAPYDCAVFWTCSPRGKIYDVTISGVMRSKDTKPILDWGRQLGRWLNKSGYGNLQLTPALLNTADLKQPWPDNLPQNGLYVPLRREDGNLRGGIVLLRAAAWSHPVRIMLDQLAEAAAYTVEALEAGVHGRKGARRGFVKLATALVFTALLSASFFIPIPVNVDVPARLAVSAATQAAASSGAAPSRVPRAPAQIDLQIPPQGAMALRPGSRLKTRVNGIDYELEVEHITPWLAGLFADRSIRARLVGAPDGLAPPELQSITIENAAMPLPLYLLRGPISAMRGALSLN